MSNVSEEMSQLSFDLLLKALSALGQLSIDGARLAHEIGRDGASTLVGLINHLQNQEYDGKTQRALKKLKTECEKEGSSAIKITVDKSSLPELKKWLDKQNLLYAACTPKKDNSSLDESESAGKGASQLTTIFFMEKDAKKVENALAIHAYQNKLINTLPPEAFFLLYDKKKDISVVDGLDYNELNVFRELAKEQGLGYTEMENVVSKDGSAGKTSAPGTYKVVCGRENADTLMAIMRMVSWTMTGPHANDVKEKIKERFSLKEELEKIISDGVRPGTLTFIDGSSNQVAVENAKYIVNAMSPYQYIKVTAKGFHRYKGGSDAEFVAKTDPDYEEKLEDALSEYPDAVIFDALEWEKDGLGKSNLRQEGVKKKLSVFPPNHSLEKDEKEIRKAQKKRLEKMETLDESAWLFYKYDPDGDKHLSEVVEEHYNDPSKPLEETVSVHYHSAISRSEKYKYYDVESDERSVDNIILEAKERVAGNSDYGKDAREQERE